MKTFAFRCFFVAFLIALSSLSAFTQSSFGGYPAHIKWSQINTPIVRVIFPDSLEDKAQRVANIIHYMNNENVGLLGEKRQKVDIILRNRDVISNGYAQIAPFKTEFFMQAPQKTFEESALDWTDQLAIHEYRHINQFLNARRGIGNLIYYLFGDYGWGALIGLTMPAWFLEGDATIAETALTTGGRGRVPSFSVEQRAQQEAGVNYSYMKAMNGSFLDFVPNHYNTGYYILSEMRLSADHKDFNEINRRASSFRGIFYPFRRAVKKVTGTKIKQHYYNGVARMKSEIPEKENVSEAITSLKPNNVVQFKNPIQDQGDIFFSYADRRKIRGLYRYVENGDHELIVNQGVVLDTYFDKHGKYFVWDEIQRDMRRGNQNFANLILYDSEEKTKRIIGRNQAYRSPSFSNDGLNLIFVNGYLGTESGIAMYNIKSNAVLQIIKSSDRQYLYPIQSADGRSIYTVVKKGHQYALAQVSLQGAFTLLTEWDDVVFGPLKLSEGHLIFQANVGSTDQIYAYELKTGLLKQISDDNIGMYNPSNYEEGKIIAERPHSQGFLLHKIETSIADWPTVSMVRKDNVPFYLQTSHLEPVDILTDVPSEQFSVTKYPRNWKFFRSHSWLLIGDGSEYSATLFSDNILNQVNIEPSYTYNANVKGSFINLNVNYGRYFPIYQLGYNFALPRIVFTNDQSRSFAVSQHSLSPGMIIPLNFTSGTYLRGLRYQTSISQTWTHVEEIGTDQFLNQQGITWNNAMSFTTNRLRALQNLFPRWGYNAVARHRYRFNDNHRALNLSNSFFVPGLLRNHGLRLGADYAQQNEPDETRIGLLDRFSYAPGFFSEQYDWALGLNATYAMPLAYPDWGFADFIYFKRITTKPFYHYNHLRFENETTEFQSIGLDLLSDVVFINNIFSEIEVGIRLSYLVGPLPEGRTSRWFFDFVYDIPAF
ncbi:TolB family protein [Portibacter marinus]|uniref:TolB family protein n=1 Tax=Portibacter marinus TaxID=2898660 RepID=UPI001F37785C|nr:hypothetical protein [Portibacter marinus]